MVNWLVYLVKKNIQVHSWMHGDQNLTKEILKLYAYNLHCILIFFLIKNVCNVLINLHFIKVDISSVIGYILSVKAENEITLMKKASLSSVEMFTKYLKDQIMEIIDSDKVYLVLYLNIS